MKQKRENMTNITNTIHSTSIVWASLVAQMVKNLPAMQETRVWSLGWEDILEKEMATHSSILAWRIPWTEEPGGLQSMGLQRVGYDWATNTHKGIRGLPWRFSSRVLQCKRHKFHLWVGKIPWRRKRLPTPVFLPGKSHGQKSLAGYSPWGSKGQTNLVAKCQGRVTM